MANRYWVGDGGNWGDTDHWSTTSGGSGGESVPTQDDDVYFDANSFDTDSQSVDMSGSANDECNFKNMDWTGVTNNPNLIIRQYYHLGSYYRLDVYCYGSLVLDEDMTLSFTWNDTYCNLRFVGDGNHFLDTKGKTTILKTIFDKGTGSITLSSDFISRYKDIEFASGTVYSGDNKIESYGGLSSYGYGVVTIKDGAIVDMEKGELRLTTDNYYVYLTIEAGANVEAEEATLSFVGLDFPSTSSVRLYYTDNEGVRFNKIILSSEKNSWGGFYINTDTFCNHFEIDMVSFLQSVYFKEGITLDCDHFVVTNGSMRSQGSDEYFISTNTNEVVNSYIIYCHALGDAIDASSKCRDDGNNTNIWFGEQANIIKKRSNNK